MCLKGDFRGNKRLPHELPPAIFRVHHPRGSPLSPVPGPSRRRPKGARGRRGPASARPPRGGAGAPVTWAAATAILQGGGEQELRGTGPQRRPPVRGCAWPGGLSDTPRRLHARDVPDSGTSPLTPRWALPHWERTGGLRPRISWSGLQRIEMQIHPPPSAAFGVTAWEQQDPLKCLRGQNKPQLRALESRLTSRKCGVRTI